MQNYRQALAQLNIRIGDATFTMSRPQRPHFRLSGLWRFRYCSFERLFTHHRYVIQKSLNKD
jgi:hypothetical protein